VTVLAKSMLALFYLAWLGAAAAWIYGARYYFPAWWAGINGRERPAGYYNKAYAGFSLFVLMVGLGLAAGAVAQVWGGGWD